MSEVKDVEGIIRNYLEEVGADGLVHIDAECGCSFEVEEGGLAPCDQMGLGCRPGWKGPGFDGYDFTMFPSKEAAEAAKARQVEEND